jgi:hypothetical protein
MSTYLPGFQAYIPQIQPFTPDYNFYNGALSQKQGQYDAAKKQLSTMYGSLLNAPLTREDNIESRDKFFKTIDQDIKKMATMDLSLAQNSEAAMGVFNQITENKNVVHDMVYTKQFQGNYQKGQYLKSCPDPEKCGGSWWEGGDRLMQYGQQEYKNASAADAINMSAPTYVSHQNVMTKAMKIAEDANLSIKQDVIQGGYVVTTKNGDLVEPALQNLLFGTLGNDPKVADYYKASAQLKRKDFMYSKQQEYGSLEAAEQEYISSIEQAVAQSQAEFEAVTEDKTEVANKKVKMLEEKQANALPDERSDIQIMLDELKGAAGAYEASYEASKEVNHGIKMAQTKPRMSGADVDAMIAAQSLQGDLMGAAQVLAYKDYEQTFKADEYSLENVKFQNRMQQVQLEHVLRKDLAKYKNDLEAGLLDITLKGAAEHNIPTIVQEGVVGGSSVTDDDDNLATRSYEMMSDNINAIGQDISSNERYVLDQILSRAENNAEMDSGNVQAQEDYVELVSNILGASAESEGALGFDGQEKVAQERGFDETANVQSAGKAENAALLAQLNNATTLAEKYKIAKRAKQKIGLEDLEGSQIDLVYDALIPKYNTNLKANKNGTRDYLKPVFDSKQILNIRRNIEAKDLHLKEAKNWYKDMSKKIVGDVKSDAEFDIKLQDPNSNYAKSQGWGSSEVTISSDVVGDGIEVYLDDNGNVVNADTFIKKMVAKGHDKATAEALYKGGRIDPSTGDYIYSAIDAYGTTVQGVGEMYLDNTFGRVAQLAGGVANVFGADVDWAPDLFEHGFDYDSATNVANWEKAGYGEGKEIAGYGSETIHDAYRKAVSKYGKPDGDMTWLGTTGAGNYAAKAQTYQIVDPLVATSVGAMGMKGVFTDFNNSSSSIVSIGGFSADKPDESDEMAKAVLQTLQMDWYNTTAKNAKTRPKLTVTYSDVAGSDANTVGLNIKFDPNYLKKYKNTAKVPGIFGDSFDDVSKEGITLYMNRDGAQNIFTTASNKTSLEQIMGLTGKISMDAVGGGYTDGFNVEAMDNGMYKASGEVQVGLDENGTKEWQWYESFHHSQSDVNDMIGQIDNLLIDVKNQNHGIRLNWLKNNMAKIK